MHSGYWINSQESPTIKAVISFYLLYLVICLISILLVNFDTYFYIDSEPNNSFKR